MTPALLAQRRRGALLRDRLRLLADRRYDPPEALLRSFSPFFPRFTGLTVAQQSLEYALLLLHSDDRTYGSDDRGEANRILRRILDFQDLREGSETFGNFFWMTHWDRVKDRNAISFLTAGLVYAFLTFPDKVEPATKEALGKAFPNCLSGIRNHKVRWQYTNIYFLNLGGLVALSRVLGDGSAHEEAIADFDRWLEGTAADGFHEFNSPTYTPVTLFGMETAWALTPDAAFHARLERTMDLINQQFALNLLPSGFLGGAPSRAYQGDALHGDGFSAFYAHLKYGTPCPPLESRDNPIYTNIALFDYVPPEAARRLVAGKPDGADVHDRGISLASRRTTRITPRWSLASQCAEKVGGHSPPSYILLARSVDSRRPSVPFLPDESFRHQPCAAFQSRQSGPRVVGRLRYTLDPAQRQRFLDDPAYYCEPRVLFGRRSDIRGVRIGNVDWGGGDVRLLPGQSVAVSFGTLALGVALQPLGLRPGSVVGRSTLAWGEDDELRLSVRIYGGPELTPEDEPADVLVLAEVVEEEHGVDLAAFAERLSLWRLEAAGDAFRAVHEGGATLAFPYTASDPDPIGDALHLSPALTLRPGDLAALVNTQQT